MIIKTTEEIHDLMHENPFDMSKWVRLDSLKECLKNRPTNEDSYDFAMELIEELEREE